MSANFENKKVVVSEIEELAKNAKSIVLVDYRGLTVAQVTELRANARNAGGVYKVYKNRLMKIAFDNLGITFPASDFEGTTAVLFHPTDEVAPAKIALDGAKKYNVLKLKSGYVDGKYYNTEEVTALANIPSREVLLAQLLGLLTSPMRSLAVGLSEVAKKNA
ncbi:MAG: 50S ribosomal protein L10 [Clostridia bacterium]|nr:50S ribosomal protein L10 [Clostridia bacterium]